MSNIKDYIKWRGDLDFSDSKFNELDNLIVAGMSYLNLDNVLNYDEEISFSELHDRISKIQKNKLKVRNRNDGIFYPLVFESNRYKDCKVTGFVKEFDEDKGIQFAALTVILPNNHIYVSFRGTTQSLVGWKEDFEMSFLDEIPAQKRSIEYLKDIANKYEGYNIYVGGHSKGGNLAIYSSIFADKSIQDRIVKIFNNDGPGIQRQIAKNPNYQKILPKVISYIPQSSIIGRLLVHEELTQVVTSIQKGIWQHDFYSWQLCGTKFLNQQTTDQKSNRIDYSLTDFLERLTNEQRKEFINIFFEVLDKSNIKTIYDLTNKWFFHIGPIISSYQQLDEMQKKILIKTFEKLYMSAIDAKKQTNQAIIDQIKEKKQSPMDPVDSIKVVNSKKPKVRTNEPAIERGINKIKKFFDNL